MTKEMFALSLGFAGLIAAAQAARAQGPQCAPRAAVVEQLAERYAEAPQAMGLTANSLVMELFASRESGSWTITVTSPQGLTCLIASGQGYEPVAVELPAKGDPA